MRADRADVAFYRFAVAVLRVVVLVWHGLRVTGGARLDAVPGGVITVSNHVTYLDCAMVAAQTRRHLAFTSKASNFSLPVAGWLVRHLGAIPVPHSPEEHEAFEARLRAHLAAGQGVHFFPEGEMVLGDPTLRPFRHGAFNYACRLGVPVVPMVLTWGPKPWWRRRPPYRLAVLPAQRPRGATPEDAVELEARCRAAMERVAGSSRW